MLTSQELFAAGIKPFHRFKECLQCNSIEGALKIWNDFQENKVHHKSIKMIPGSIWAWLCGNPCFENIGTNSEKRRMIEQKCVEINHDTDLDPDEELPPIITLRFFPNNHKKRITML